MKIAQLVDLLRAGKCLTVRLHEHLWDESFGEPGMIAIIQSITEDGAGDYNMIFDYSKFREHNMSLAANDFYINDELAAKLGRDTGNAVESGCIKDDLQEHLWWDANDDVPVRLVDDDSLMGMYLKDAIFKGTYSEWLEKQLQDMVPALVNALTTLVDLTRHYMTQDEYRSEAFKKCTEVLGQVKTLYSVLKYEEGLHAKANSDKGA
jgi:hypothetical protein